MRTSFSHSDLCDGRRKLSTDRLIESGIPEGAVTVLSMKSLQNPVKEADTENRNETRKVLFNLRRQDVRILRR
jgi:hypothetical protein